MGVTRGIIIISIAILLAAIFFSDLYPDFHSVIMKVPYLHSITAMLPQFISGVYVTHTPDKPHKTMKKSKTEHLYSPEELKDYDGSPGSKGLCLGILGRVYNVKKGKAHYGPGGGYSFFTGRDGSRAFVSGDFTENGLVDDVTGLSFQDYIGLKEWVQLYEKDYKYVGKIVGRYYDETGNPTEYNLQVQKWTDDAFAQKDSEDKEKKRFPPCNSEWFAESGTRVWCTKRSGGVQREWVGVPRKFYYPGRQKARCACIRNFGSPSAEPTAKSHNNNGDLDYPKLGEYKGCDPSSDSCNVIKSDQ